MPVRQSAPKATIKQMSDISEPALAAPLDILGTGAPTANAEVQLAYDPNEVTENLFPAQQYLPSDRIPAGEIIYVRNNTRSIVRFTDGHKDQTFNIKMEPAGNAESIVSLEEFGVLRNPGFQRWWKAGKVTVTNDNTIAPLPLDTDLFEIERHQQFALEGTLERTLPGSLPLPKSVDMSFLDQYKKGHPDYKG